MKFTSSTGMQTSLSIQPNQLSYEILSLGFHEHTSEGRKKNNKKGINPSNTMEIY